MKTRIPALALVVLSFSGCYVLRQGTGLLRYQSRAQDFEELTQDAETPAETLDFLDLVDDIRQFGVQELGLGESRNYSSYVAVDQDYLVNVVSASKDDSFQRKTWWFPVVGTVPYKGFYNRAPALRLARRLKQRDYDVLVRKVDAFSTLGFFRDPIYSFMEDYSVYELASLIFHEQTHATIFLKNQVQFNEELASFVGTEGALLYVSARVGPDAPELVETTAARRDQQTFVAVLRELYDELADLYQQDLPREATLKGKSEIIKAHQILFAEDYDRRFETEGYRSFADAEINNAYLNLYATYTRDLELFYQLYERNGADLKATVDALRVLDGFKGDPKELMRTELLGPN